MVGLEELKKLRAVVQNLPDHVFIVSENGHCLDLYEGSERMTPIDYSNIIGKHAREVFPATLARQVEDKVSEALATQKAQFVTYSLKVQDIKLLPDSLSLDDELWFEGRITPLAYPYGEQKAVMWVARDITKRRRLEQEIKQLVDFDELTGIYNRRRFLAQLSKAYAQFRRYNQQTTVVMVDIDDFKVWNDSLGHIAGDHVIQHVTKVCGEILRESDCFGRLGGEEFAIILPHTGVYDAAILGERLRSAIETTPCMVDGIEVGVTISIGIAGIEQSDQNQTEVLRRADIAMYRSKELGKNRVTAFAE